MKITLSLNEDGRIYYKDTGEVPDNYSGSFFLYKTLINKGHDVTIVHPNDLFNLFNEIYASKTYGFTENRFCNRESNKILNGNIFFVDSLGEDKTPNVSRRFIMDYLPLLEHQFDHVLNSAESTSYEYKPKQKSLDLPWIPEYKIRNNSDLLDLIASGEKIIAKPHVGCFGRGIKFLGDLTDVINFPKEQINFYFFEKYIPSNEERRYLFLDGDLIIRRIIIKNGNPGKEKYLSIGLMEGFDHEAEIARKAINETGMFYGAVDFREGYVLEINGSGTGIVPAKIDGEEYPYNLSGVITRKLEEKLSLINNISESDKLQLYLTR